MITAPYNHVASHSKLSSQTRTKCLSQPVIDVESWLDEARGRTSEASVLRSGRLLDVGTLSDMTANIFHVDHNSL